ncbi:hypothetical protein JR316_0000380 [Psilocybe cubensis]|uniref:Uncharacterized protein n=2 Tax=Psilocybe cubensis TaxID=181762 RepID=A0ACB8HEN2_PSICU|nr:hypothetical protein JR316_0000380 [Psilocybe cubensis]KAH9486316.1 hypothetical protein JR316_0000380 [Psilocybe cubensis]
MPQSIRTIPHTRRSTSTFKADHDMQTSSGLNFTTNSWRILGRCTTLVAAAAREERGISINIDNEDMKSLYTHTPVDSAACKWPKQHFKSNKHKLVLQERAKTIVEFRDVRELLNAFSDAIIAHGKAHDKAQILHRDIAPGNIMIRCDGHGVLLDWDLPELTSGQANEAHLFKRTVPYFSFSESVTSFLIIVRQGALHFMAYRLGGKQEKGEPVPRHNKDDDLESFFLVLYWIALRCCNHGYIIGDLKAHMKNNYYTAIVVGGKHVAPLARKDLFSNSMSIMNARFASPPLIAFLTVLHQTLRLRYLIREDHKILLISWIDAALKCKKTLTEREIALELRAKMYAQDSDYTDPTALDLSFSEIRHFIQYLKSDWASNIFVNLFGHNGEKADWEFGNSTKLLPSTQIHLTEKRKFHSIDMCTNNNDHDDDGQY